MLYVGRNLAYINEGRSPLQSHEAFSYGFHLGGILEFLAIGVLIIIISAGDGVRTLVIVETHEDLDVLVVFHSWIHHLQCLRHLVQLLSSLPHYVFFGLLRKHVPLGHGLHQTGALMMVVVMMLLNLRFLKEPEAFGLHILHRLVFHGTRLLANGFLLDDLVDSVPARLELHVFKHYVHFTALNV